MKRILTVILFITFYINPLSAQELTGTLQQIQTSGKIKIGYRQSLPPMSFLDRDNIPVGYSIDLCENIVNEIEKKLGRGITIEYIPVTAGERFQALIDNRIDLLCGATTKTLSRSEIVDFTQLTFVTGASIMTLRDKRIGNDLNGKKIGAVKGTTTASELKKVLTKTQINARIVLLDSISEGVNTLKNGKIDAFAADQIVLIGLALTEYNPNEFSISPDLFSYEPLALAVRKNDAAFRLVADRAISNLFRSKQILKIYDKWLSRFSEKRPAVYETLVILNAIPE